MNEVQTFLGAVESAAFRWLAAGDIAYTNDGLPLSEMFRRLGTMDDAVIDFCKWYIETREIERLKAIKVATTAFRGLS